MKQIDTTKLVPCEASQMTPGEKVFCYYTDRDEITHGRFVAYVPDASPSCQMIVKWVDACTPELFTVDGRVTPSDPQVIFRGEPVYLPEPQFHIGQVFLVGGGYHMLAQIDNKTYALISITNGNRYRNPVSSCDNSSDISAATLELCGAQPDQLVTNMKLRMVPR